MFRQQYPFVLSQQRKVNEFYGNLIHIQVLHSHIAAIERLPLTAAGSPLRVRTKTFRVVTFVISRERDCVDVYATLLSLSSPGKYFLEV